MTIEVDGLRIPASGSVLDVCRAAGIEVPTFCHDERTSSGGHCRACMVIVDGRFVPACTTRAVPGMKITTDGPELREYRRDLGELMLASASPKGEALSRIVSFGAQGDRYPKAAAAHPRDTSHPFLRIVPSACILCRRCVQVCAEVQGSFVFAVAGRGATTHLTFGDQPFSATACVACGACAEVCPSEAISDLDRSLPRGRGGTRAVRTTCAYCGVGCQLDVHVGGDTVARIDGARTAPNHGHLCVKGRYAHGFVRHRERLTRPLLRIDGRFEPVSYGTAIAFVARELKRLAGRVAALSSSRCTNEENYLVQKWFRGALATNNVDCCARVCHAPSAAGLRRSFGTGAATNSFDDIEKADLLFVAGANPTVAHPVLGARIQQATLRGAKLVVIDPRRTGLAEIADLHLQPLPGTNVPLLNSLAAVLVEERLVDLSFVRARTEGFDAFAAFVRHYPPEATEAVTGVPAAEVRRAARLYAHARAPMQFHGLGMTEHFQGSETVMLLCNLALLRAAVGRGGVGVNPLRGQNNVQGAADMGCQPDLTTGSAHVDDAAVQARFFRQWGRPLPSTPGLTLPRMYDAIDAGAIRGLYVLGEDLVQTDPDADRVRERLRRLELLVVQEIFFSETAALATVVLPGASFLEKDGTFTSGERRIQRVRKAFDPPGDALPDWRILLDLMDATGWPQPHATPQSIWDEVRTLAPSFAGASYEALERGGLAWPVTADAPGGTPILHRDGFPQGRAAFQVVEFLPSPSRASTERPLLLVTGRILEHYNSGSMTRRSRNLAKVSHDSLEIHPEDATPRGITSGMPVTVASASGSAHAVASVTRTIRPGTVFLSFHFPETHTNRVTTAVVDRLSDCPEYKLTPVEVTPAEEN